MLTTAPIFDRNLLSCRLIALRNVVIVAVFFQSQLLVCFVNICAGIFERSFIVDHVGNDLCLPLRVMTAQQMANQTVQWKSASHLGLCDHQARFHPTMRTGVSHLRTKRVTPQHCCLLCNLATLLSIRCGTPSFGESVCSRFHSSPKMQKYGVPTFPCRHPDQLEVWITGHPCGRSISFGTCSLFRGISNYRHFLGRLFRMHTHQFPRFLQRWSPVHAPPAWIPALSLSVVTSRLGGNLHCMNSSPCDQLDDRGPF